MHPSSEPEHDINNLIEEDDQSGILSDFQSRSRQQRRSRHKNANRQYAGEASDKSQSHSINVIPTSNAMMHQSDEPFDSSPNRYIYETKANQNKTYRNNPSHLKAAARKALKDRKTVSFEFATPRFEDLQLTTPERSPVLSPQGPIATPLDMDVTEHTPLNVISIEKHKKEEGWTGRLAFLVISVNLGGFLIGYSSAVLNPILSDIYESCDFKSSFLKGFLVSTAAIGGLIGAAIGIKSNESYGRKNSIIISDIFMGFGSLMPLFGPQGSVTVTLAVLARLFVGIGVGLAGMSIPIYLSEIAPPDIRGGAMTIHAASQNIGQLVAIGVCSGIFYLGLNKQSIFFWRWVLAGAAFPCFIHMFMMFWFPKSPRWLIQKKKTDEAVTVLSEILNIPHTTAQFRAVKIAKTYRALSVKDLRLWNDLSSRAFRGAMVIGCGLALFQQFSGINTIMNYSTTIIQSVGLAPDAADAVYWSLPIVFLQAVATMLSIRVIDRFGRKPLLMISLSGVCVALFVLTASSYIVGFAENGTIHSKTNRFANMERIAQYFCLISMFLYIVTYAPGLGPVPVAVNSEIFPTHLRGLGGSVFIMITWACSSVVTLIFPLVSSRWGMGSAFAINFVASLIGLFFVQIMVFETKGQDLERIVRRFSRQHLSDMKKEYGAIQTAEREITD